MRRPYPRNSGMTPERRTAWVDRFNAYRDAPSEGRVDRWIQQFDGADQDLATRVLDCVEVVSTAKIATAFRMALRRLPGWSLREEEREGRWYFVGLGESAGESGDSMIHLFRQANNMEGRRFKELFRYKAELPALGLQKGDNVVFVDDFSGSGNQACQAWKRFLQEMVGGGPNLYLVLVCVAAVARARISEETDLIPVAEIVIGESDDVFSAKCRAFDAVEKGRLLEYCYRASPRAPKGYADCGLLLVLAHRCPNNSLPVLHANHRGWIALFPRHF
jgi:hypothetical protein